MPALRLFHGTNHQFDSFDIRHLGRCVRNPTTIFGFFFSDNESDAAYWPLREQERNPGAQYRARLLEVDVSVGNLKEISAAKFHWYLQHARASTIQRHRAQWISDGFDGIAVTRPNGHRWVAPFDVGAIRVVASRDVQSLDMPSVDTASQQQSSVAADLSSNGSTASTSSRRRSRP